ncbi:CocE/NonD family hydrolase [Duganella sp. FT50W]|uniref:CocE/NonD family hydrolase n=1 Tax=Duganella lactea TaxID=2692173 RepID=A0A6L8MQN5_9BURK|nr:CocE/NonD family hydrolase [Duganella lactea]MYM84315.1 CocE/NonD family hydrolase [Duganella lactea]
MQSPTTLRAATQPFTLHHVMVPMRDGIHLATDIYLPLNAHGLARHPAILERTPYGKSLPSRSEIDMQSSTPLTRAQVASYFTQRGYVVVYQDCRGRYDSEGVFVKYTSDGEDGYDTCAWIVAQAWSNGKIGTKGLSYAAHTQAALGSLGAPGVVAMFLDSGGFSNAYQGGIRQGGAFELKQVTWAIKRAMESPAIINAPEKARHLAELDIAAWFRRIHSWLPGDSPLSAAPEYEHYLFDQWQRGAFDDYWRQPGLYANGYHANFPAAASLHMSSWFDPYARTAIENFQGLLAAGKGPCKLILGPWTHGDRSRSWNGDVDFGAQSTLDGNLAQNYLALRLRWFERYLKQETSAPDDAAVQLFVMGGGSGKRNADGRLDHGGHWRSEATWPLSRTVPVAYYLHASGSLSPEPDVEAPGTRKYTYDPSNPVPTLGGAVTSGEPLMTGGGFDQRPLQERRDILRFQTDPLATDMEITGTIEARLWIASSCVDTDFTLKLIDVYPDGYELILTDSIIRCRYRNSWEHPEMLTPDTMTAVTVTANPVSNLFKAGHRIRLDIASSNFPKYDANPNTGGPEGPGGATRIAINTLYCGTNHPSHVILPIIPAPVVKLNPGRSPSLS